MAPRRIEDRLARRGGIVELLHLPAALFGGVARVRGYAYDRGWMPVARVGTPVVSVGNLTAGGTGKTPMVRYLVRELVARGLRPGILSRGYRGGGGGPNDEALELAAYLPDVPHVQDRDRVAGALELQELGVDVIVLDDGFQHRRLARDLDLVLVDATRPWGLEPEGPGADPVRAFLPRGLLREPPAALDRADVVVATRVDRIEPTGLTKLRADLGGRGAGWAEAVHRPVALRRVTGAGGLGQAEREEPSTLAGVEVDLVSGIGNPAAFEQTVRDLGIGIAGHRRFPDHHPFTATDLAGLGGRPVLTTGKDAARWLTGPGVAPGLELFALEVELVMVAGESVLGALLDGLPEAAARRERRAIHEGLHG